MKLALVGKKNQVIKIMLLLLALDLMNRYKYVPILNFTPVMNSSLDRDILNREPPVPPCRSAILVPYVTCML